MVDYGLGNIQNVQSALDFLGLKHTVDNDGSLIGNGDICLIPGVAAFGEGIKGLHARGQAQAICDFAREGRQIVGLCLGAQMLFDRSEESPDIPGLGVISGDVVKLEPDSVRVPNQGWSKVSRTDNFQSEPESLDNYFYFSHGYQMKPSNSSILMATMTESSTTISAIVRQGNVTGVQFHPERSGPAGLELLRHLLKKAD